MTQIMQRLLEVDKVKLLTIIRNLNAKYEFAHLAQYMMTEILPKFQNYEFLSDMRKTASEGDQPDLKSLLEGTSVYQDKHYNRIQRHLRNSYFIDFVVSQMTLQEDETTVIKTIVVDDEIPLKNKRQVKQQAKSGRRLSEDLVNKSK